MTPPARRVARLSLVLLLGIASACTPKPGTSRPEMAEQARATAAGAPAPTVDSADLVMPTPAAPVAPAETSAAAPISAVPAAPSSAAAAALARAHAPAPSANVAYGPSECDGRLLDHGYYVACHSATWRIPRWVVYHVTTADLAPTVPRHDAFRPDPDLPAAERAELSDYAGTAYDRGHMAPADDFRRSADAMNMTFLLSNMAPQRHSLNGGRWRVLEGEVHAFAAACGSAWVVTGPLFLNAALQPVAPRTFIHHRVAVPTHFFKAVLCERPDGHHEMYAFLMAHKQLPGPTLRYAVTVDRIEALSGIDLFGPLPDAEEDSLEAHVATVWPVHN